jgi:hypothetical protein
MLGAARGRASRRIVRGVILAASTGLIVPIVVIIGALALLAVLLRSV